MGHQAAHTTHLQFQGLTDSHFQHRVKVRFIQLGAGPGKLAIADLLQQFLYHHPNFLILLISVVSPSFSAIRRTTLPFPGMNCSSLSIFEDFPYKMDLELAESICHWQGTM